MSILSVVRGWFGSTVTSAPTWTSSTTSTYPCVNLDGEGFRRHYFEGAAFCLRGCGAANPNWKPDEAVAVPTEG